MSKNGPVRPSAWNQLVAGAETPALSCPPLKRGDPKYIARSAMIGMVLVTEVENDWPTKSAGSSAAQKFARDIGTYPLDTDTGAAPWRRKLSVTVAGAALALANRMNVSKMPGCAWYPSPKYHVVWDHPRRCRCGRRSRWHPRTATARR